MTTTTAPDVTVTDAFRAGVDHERTRLALAMRAERERILRGATDYPHAAGLVVVQLLTNLADQLDPPPV